MPDLDHLEKVCEIAENWYNFVVNNDFPQEIVDEAQRKAYNADIRYQKALDHFTDVEYSF